MAVAVLGFPNLVSREARKFRRGVRIIAWWTMRHIIYDLVFLIHFSLSSCRIVWDVSRLIVIN